MTRPFLVILTVSAIALTGCTPSPAPSGSPAAASPTATASGLSTKLLTAAHLVSQEGLAIALASNVLQSQLLLVEDSDDPTTSCTALAGGGAHAVSNYGGDDSSHTFTETIYYDSGCSQAYMTLVAQVDESGDSITATATVNYTGTKGADLGTMATKANASLAGSGIGLVGTGAYTRTGAQPVSLGLACSGDTSLACQGGVAQYFPTLKTSLGSITPLTLTLGDDAQNQPLPFSGSGNSTASLAKGTLSIVSDGTNLSFQGATPVAGDAASSGSAGSFSLFPPTPTGWTVTDAAGDVAFTISVVDDTTRALTGTITQSSTKKVLATLSVDQSGTGTITYAGQKPTAITSWTLAD